jgi:ElaB/YqjD/DUF883 family membrane-anchored ribosome-binding protein
VAKKQEKTSEPEKTIGKEAAKAKEAVNGAIDDAEEKVEDVKEDVQEAAEKVGASFEKARKDLQESVSKLREEIADFDMKDARQRTRTWVEENPTLALFLTVGTGLLVGRIIVKALTPAPPPPLPKRLQARGKMLASQAQDYAYDLGDIISDRTADAVSVLSRKASQATEAAIRRAHELGEDVARQAGVVSEQATDRAAEWGDIIASQSSRAAHAAQDRAEDLAGAAKTKASHGIDVTESLFNAAKTAAAAFIVKKVTDLFRS